MVDSFFNSPKNKINNMKLFFYSIYSDTILNDRKPPVAIGGADVQMAMWTRSFAKKCNVYTFSYYLNRLFAPNGWGIHFCFFPLVRKVMFLLNRIKPLALLLAKPDIVILRSIPSEIKIVEWVRKKLNIEMMFMIASDMDVNPEAFGWDKRFPEMIKKADYVIAQNKYQYEMATRKLGVKNIAVIPNVWDSDMFGTLHLDKIYDYIWVANFREIKRPEWIVDIAEANPQKSFAVVGGSLGNYARLCKKLTELPNVEYLGSKTLFETTRLVAQSRCLLCTSVKEGFPNTFLQALSCNVPIISTVNPNEMIEKYKLGFVANTVEDFNSLIQNNAILGIKSEDIAAYFENNHSIDRGMQIINALLLKNDDKH